MKTTAEMIAVMQAYVDGKEIEYRCGDYQTWRKTIDPLWDWYKTDYRVKTEPEYIPFTFEDAEFLIGKALKHKKENYLAVITRCFNKNTDIGDYEELLDEYTFIDGSPCGKLKK